MPARPDLGELVVITLYTLQLLISVCSAYYLLSVFGREITNIRITMYAALIAKV